MTYFLFRQEVFTVLAVVNGKVVLVMIESGKESGRIAMRIPENEKERLLAALCSIKDDLYLDGNGNVVVTGVLPNGDRIYLGEISGAAFAQKNTNPAYMINKVRFVN